MFVFWSCAPSYALQAPFGGSKVRYTLQRLSVREETTVFWWAGYNAVCFLFFWAVQLVIALLLCRLYVTRMNAAYVSDQTIFLAFYRNSFLHSLLPLDETSRYVRNVVLIPCLGILTAHFSFVQRRGRRAISMVVLTTIVLVNFSKPMGSFASDLLLSLLALSLAAGPVVEILREGGYENGPRT